MSIREPFLAEIGWFAPAILPERVLLSSPYVELDTVGERGGKLARIGCDVFGLLIGV
jgi:hypothetical protein